VDEEQFGPMLPVTKFTKPEDTIVRIGAGPFQLGGSNWSNNTNRAYELASRLDAGTVWVNKHFELAPNIPFGGSKQSGLGAEFGEEDLAECTQLKIIGHYDRPQQP
jgi:acyl-CoA reductase-like NAD-dependent aldehyde dehydrogenase